MPLALQILLALVAHCPVIKLVLVQNIELFEHVILLRDSVLDCVLHEVIVYLLRVLLPAVLSVFNLPD